jgi:Uncharacterized conserved protein (DUF2190)
VSAITGILDYPYQASAALVRNRFVKISGNQTVAPVAAVTDAAIGVNSVDVSTTEATSGKTVDVHILGVAFVEAAAAITIGAFVAPSANGQAQTAVSTQFGMGVALKAATNAGDIIPVLLMPYLRTTAMGTA